MLAVLADDEAVPAEAPPLLSLVRLLSFLYGEDEGVFIPAAFGHADLLGCPQAPRGRYHRFSAEDPPYECIVETAGELPQPQVGA
jgi:hypothetical protein